MIKKILVPFYGAETEVAALDTAFTIANDFAAQVECLHISADLQTYYGYPVPEVLPMAAQDKIHDEVSLHQEKQAEIAYQRFWNCKENNEVALCLDTCGEKSRCATWIHEKNPVTIAMEVRGRTTDLIVLSQSINNTHTSYFHLIYDALFRTAKPVILVPTKYKAPKKVARVVVAWDGSLEATRAVHHALPILQQAEDVTVLTLQQKKDDDHVTAKQLIRYLKAHDIDASHKDVERVGRSTSKTIMETAEQANADLLVMGAYSHNRFRQMVLGGVTKFMLEHATVPVLMTR